jgi:hypothetical protein
MKSMPIEDEVP